MVTFSKGQSTDNCDNVGPKASQRGDINERYSSSYPHHAAPILTCPLPNDLQLSPTLVGY